MVADPKALSRLWEGAIGLVYPAQCPGCGAAVGRSGTLCPACWAEAEFIGEGACADCGAPVPSGLEGGDRCDACATMPRVWHGARAAMVYRGAGRRLALALKHGDRADLAPVLGRWLAEAAAPLVVPGMVVVPVPLHARRLLRRRYNQAGLLAAAVARRHRLALAPAGLARLRHTPMQGHGSLAERFDNLRGVMAVPARQVARLRGRPVLLVDDVMASGATLTAAAEAVLAAGASFVAVAVLARAVRDH